MNFSKLAQVAISVSILSACSAPETQRPRGLVGVDGKPLASPPPAQAAEEREVAAAPAPRSSYPARRLPSPFAGGPALDPGALSAPAQPAEVPALPAPSQPPKGPGRDLSKELAALIAQPAGCVDLAEVAKQGGKLTISVNASVMPSGRISQASVSAPGQPQKAVACLEARVTSAALPGNVPGAPLTVTAAADVDVVAQAQPAPPPTAEPAKGPVLNLARPEPGPTAQAEPGPMAEPEGAEFAQPSQ